MILLILSFIVWLSANIAQLTIVPRNGNTHYIVLAIALLASIGMGYGSRLHMKKRREDYRRMDDEAFKLFMEDLKKRDKNNS